MRNAGVMAIASAGASALSFGRAAARMLFRFQADRNHPYPRFIATYFVSRYSWRPSGPPSRP